MILLKRFFKRTIMRAIADKNAPVVMGVVFLPDLGCFS
jgi:hypothetical protein